MLNYLNHFIHNRFIILSRFCLTSCALLLLIFGLVPFPVSLLGVSHDKIKHAIVFFILTLAFDASWPKKTLQIKDIIILNLFGFLLELLQTMTVNRSFSLWDCIANLIGMITYIASQPLLKKTPILNIRWKFLHKENHNKT